MELSFGAKLPGVIPHYVPGLRELPDFVAELERIGFDDVSTAEHVLFTPTMVHPCGAGDMVHRRSDKQSDRGDPLITFTALAMRTERIRFVSAVVLAAVHGFGVLAAQAATLDLLSGGRFVLGVGGGWHAAEFAAQGVPPAERAARTEDVMRACRELWRPGLAEYHGRWIDFAGVVGEPAPHTPGGPPLWWGGNALTGATSRRVAEFCAGWLSREADGYEEIARSVEAIHAACETVGRDPATVGIRASVIPTAQWRDWSCFEDIVDLTVSNCRRLARAGVTHFSVPLNYFKLELHELERLLKELRAA